MLAKHLGLLKFYAPSKVLTLGAVLGPTMPLRSCNEKRLPRAIAVNQTKPVLHGERTRPSRRPTSSRCATGWGTSPRTLEPVCVATTPLRNRPSENLKSVHADFKVTSTPNRFFSGKPMDNLPRYTCPHHLVSPKYVAPSKH